MLAEREAAKRQIMISAVTLASAQRKLMEMRKKGVELPTDYTNVKRLSELLKDAIWRYLRSL